MRNLLAGLLGSIIGAVLIVFLLDITHLAYPQPYDLLWIIFAGNNAQKKVRRGTSHINNTKQTIEADKKKPIHFQEEDGTL